MAAFTVQSRFFSSTDHAPSVCYPRMSSYLYYKVCTCLKPASGQHLLGKDDAYIMSFSDESSSNLLTFLSFSASQVSEYTCLDLFLLVIETLVILRYRRRDGHPAAYSWITYGHGRLSIQYGGDKSLVSMTTNK